MSKIDDIEAYIINLESRKDRLEKSLKQAKNLGIEYRVIQAVDKYSIPADKLDFLAPEVVANWESHMKVYREFLKSDKKFALVLEDDFTLSHKFNHKFFTNQKIFYFDFVQIGYLKMIWADHIAIRFQNSRDLLFKILNYFSLKFQIKFLRSKLLIREQANIPFKFVLNDIRAGSHAQIVSRNFAKNMLRINDPQFLSTDLLFMSIGTLRTFKMARLRSSLISQDQSRSDIVNRFKIPESGIKK